MSATHLNMGYYGWRDGTRVEMKYTDGIIERMSPQLNAGTAATQSLFSKLYRHDTWFNALYGRGDSRNCMSACSAIHGPGQR